MFSTLTAAPSQVTLTFPEPLNQDRSTVNVYSFDEERVDLEDTRVLADRPEVLTVGLRDGLKPGYYAVTWDIVLANENHRTNGRYVFLLEAIPAEIEPPALEVSALPSGDASRSRSPAH